MMGGNPMERFESSRSTFTKAKVEFFQVFEDKSSSLEEKLSSLIAVAETIGEIKENSEDFESNVLREVQFKDEELYDAYQASLKNLAA